MDTKKIQFQRKFILRLFLICSFPIHFWSLLIAFSEFEAVGARTVMWDAVGYISYALIFAFIESVIITSICWLISFLLPKGWEQEKILVILGTYFYILLSWSAFEQGIHLFPELYISKATLYYLEHFVSRSVILLGTAGLVSLGLPGILFWKVKPLVNWISLVFDRIILLSYLYLFLDIVGLVIVIYRNIPV
jgi:hypothetical protein